MDSLAERTCKGPSGVFALFCCALFAQPSAPLPRFDFADIHSSAKTGHQVLRTAPARDGRYEIRAATMLDLIRIAWNVDAERVVGGPDWLELDKFDITAKAAADSTAAARRLMLQSLLKDRFRLVLLEGAQLVPTWALASEKKLSLKEAHGSGKTFCRSEIDVADPQGRWSIMSVAI